MSSTVHRARAWTQALPSKHPTHWGILELISISIWKLQGLQVSFQYKRETAGGTSIFSWQIILISLDSLAVIAILPLISKTREGGRTMLPTPTKVSIFIKIAVLKACDYVRILGFISRKIKSSSPCREKLENVSSKRTKARRQTQKEIKLIFFKEDLSIFKAISWIWWRNDSFLDYLLSR